MFLQHFIKMLKAGGRAGVVIKNTFLSNSDNASISLRKLLLENCNLHTILDCPKGTFHGIGTQTVVLFFEKGKSTKTIWYYQLDPGRNMGKTTPLNDDDMSHFLGLQKIKKDSVNSWSKAVTDLNPKTADLSVQNPNGEKSVCYRTPAEIFKELQELEMKSSQVLEELKKLL